MTCPRMGNTFMSLHSFLALNPVQLKIISYSPFSCSSDSSVRLITIPPLSVILDKNITVQ